ncbi:MAG: YezD family protein [Novosphingobium sp.]|uniref:YezD family protein n=1 Tax=Novosphingobium sp. TaxID=1874826 RepID=UPI0032B7FE49
MPGESAPTNHGPQAPAAPAATGVLQAVGEAVSRLRYGVVQLTVHDGKVVQLDVTERQRFP